MARSPNKIALPSPLATARLAHAAARGLTRGVARHIISGSGQNAVSLPVGVAASVAREGNGVLQTLPPAQQRGTLQVLSRFPRTLPGLTVVSDMEIGGVPGLRVHSAGTLPADSPLLFYLHGGGYIFGAPRMFTGFLAKMAKAAGAEIVAVDYRTAPEYPFPAALEDAHAAYQSVLDEGISPARVILLGDSAGAGLSMSLLQILRDERAALPAGAVLFSPWCDLGRPNGSRRKNVGDDYLTPGALDRCARWYAGATDREHPLLSPVYGDLSGLPPLLVFAGTAEVLLDDAKRLVTRAEQQGTKATLSLYPGMTHNWPVVAPFLPASQRARREAATFIATITKQDSEPGLLLP